MRRRILSSIALASLLAVSACSDDDGDSDDVATADSVEPSGETTTLPLETSDTSRIAFTPTITITEDGFLPLQAVAVFTQTLTFVNETDRAQTITFTNGSPQVGGPKTFGPIPAGESMEWPDPLDTAISLVFEADSLPGQTGRLQIDPGVDEL